MTREDVRKQESLEIQIRGGEPKDVPAISDLARRARSSLCEEGSLDELRMGPYVIAVARIESGLLLASAIHTTREESKEKGAVHISLMVVDPLFQDQGVGERLRDYLWEKAKSWGLDTLVAEIPPEDYEIQASLRKLGFSLEFGADGKPFIHEEDGRTFCQMEYYARKG